nr:MAG TPA: hypothetical protein [Caudoviricetes sp.]
MLCFFNFLPYSSFYSYIFFISTYFSYIIPFKKSLL